MTVTPDLASGKTTAAFWVAGPGRGEIRTETLPEPSGSEAVVRTLYSGISRGTETLVYTGHVPASEYDRMRAPFQAGDFPGPVKYGYANVGTVLYGPDDLEGRDVFCLYPHQREYVVPAEALYRLPPGVPPQRAILAANLETALNAVWDAGIRPGQHVAVVGAGSIGCLVAWMAARIDECSVELIDVNANRAALARALGLRFAAPSAAAHGAQVVLHASGTAEGLATALGLCAYEATVIELSWYGDRPVPIALGGAFHSQRLTIKSSQVGGVAPSHRKEWSRRRRLEYALALLTAPALDALINSEDRFEALPGTLARLAHGHDDRTVMHRVRYS